MGSSVRSLSQTDKMDPSGNYAPPPSYEETVKHRNNFKHPVPDEQKFPSGGGEICHRVDSFASPCSGPASAFPSVWTAFTGSPTLVQIARPFWLNTKEMGWTNNYHTLFLITFLLDCFHNRR